MNKIVAVFIAIVALGVFVQADVAFFDDFNRADTASPDGGLNSSDYTEVGDFYLSDGSAVHDNNSSTAMGIYSGDTLDADWVVSVDAAALSSGTITGGRYVGAVWNYQDSNNYYVFRVNVTGSSWQFLEYNGGSIKTFNSGAFGSTLSLDTLYTISVESTGTAGSFDYAVLDGVSELAAGTVSDANGSATLTDGYAGFYSSNTHSQFDNVAIPEPTTLGLIGATSVMCLFIRRLKL